MAMTRGLGAVAAACALAAALVGCSSEQSSVTANGRTLLMYHSSGASADALGYGVLGVNAKGCVTLGENVLVVPDSSSLQPDGSVRIDGKTYQVGTKIKLGGGSGDAPHPNYCGAGVDYFWAG